MTREFLTINDLESEFTAIQINGNGFFGQATDQCRSEDARTSFSRHDMENPDRYWNCLSDETKEQSHRLVRQIISASASLSAIAKASTLTGNEDILAIKIATKSIRSALRLRKYYFHEAEAIHDEGTVLGLRPAEQSDNEAASPISARQQFSESMSDLSEIFQLVSASGNEIEVATSATKNPNNNYRSGTAFIMMWMDPNHPELTDVADTVRGVFKNFGVKALRADDIEHESLVTERILNEIRSSEFLFADLTGMRPNVYYEVGYAHALNKRVILFRKEGTDLHFDLAGYNCPDYQNLRDLKEKLTRRLEHITNKRPIDQ